MSNSESKSKGKQDSSNDISRREMLLGMGAVAAMAYSGSAVSAMPGHDHSKHSAQLPELLDATNTCLDKGQRCIAHCLVAFQEGDTQLADCASKVHEMQAVCSGFSYLLAANSTYVKEFAKICERVCTDCEKECRKHEEHVECKQCAEACAATVDAIKTTMM